jgi:opacity protein-like surface antigen
MSRRRPLALLLLLALAGAGPASAGEVSAFVGFPTPTDTWGRSYGATLSSTWFQLVALEGEAARVRGEDPENGMTSFSASALLAPPIGFFTPYGGLGVGVFRQTAADDSDTGILRAFILGAKMKIGLVVVRAEYRHLDLGDAPMLPMDRRVSVGAGIAF